MSLDLTTFTLLHVLISLIGIVSGFVVMIGLLTSRTLSGWTATFLATTILTSVIGFFFSFAKLLPSHIVGIISLMLLAGAVFALYVRHMRGTWRPIYIATAMLSLCFNVVVLIIQGFLKVGALKALAPTQTEPPFLIVQSVVLIAFIGLIIDATKKFRPSAPFLIQEH